MCKSKMITRSGFILDETEDIQQRKRDLTVRPIQQGDYAAPPSFKVYRESRGRICVPRYYGTSLGDKPYCDTRVPPCVINTQFHCKLRDYQKEPMKKGIHALETVGGGVLSLPCGFGKTITSLAIAAHMNVRTMILVHKEFLANQWKEVIQRICPGSTIGLVQGDTIDIDKDFVICMIQTLSQRDYEFGTFDSIGLMIVDECHHICARVFSQCMFKLCPKYTLGLSATPERKDGLTKVLYWFLGPLFYNVQRVSDNVKVRTIHFSGPFPEVSTTQYGKISIPQMITNLCGIEERNQLIYATIDELLQTDRRILVLTDRRHHAIEFLERYGDLAGLYIGGMKQVDLDESAKKKIIIATFALAQEGLDIPNLDTAIFTTPKSDIVQASGRVLRGSAEPIIYDVVDHWSVFHGMYRKRLVQYINMQFCTDEIKYLFN